MNWMLNILMDAAIFLALFVFMSFLFWLLFGYKISEKGIVIKLLRLVPVYFIPIDDIVEVNKESYGIMFLYYTLNRLIIRNNLFTKAVVIKCRKNIFYKEVEISPINPDNFILEVREKINKKVISGLNSLK
jgi:hypothetical protein